MKKCLLYLDEANLEHSCELLGAAAKIHQQEAYQTYAVAVNHTMPDLYGRFDHLIRIADKRIRCYDAQQLAAALTELNQRFAFDSILFPATRFGRMLAPRLAMRLKVGLVADVTAITHTDGRLELVRPAFRGKIMAAINGAIRRPLMMSVRQNVFCCPAILPKETQIINFQPKSVSDGKIQLLESKNKAPSNDIRDSEVLISGGGGMLEHIAKLDPLAEALHGQVSVSRRVVDAGAAPRSIQVGQSGKTVSPRLYMALGIYGSVQHVEGLKNVETIVAVNTDRHAPICSLAELVIEADAADFAEKFTEKIRSEATATKK